LGFLLVLLLGWVTFGGVLTLFAAVNDANFQAGTQITSNGVTVTVKQSAVESLTVDSGSFSAVMPAGSALYITSADKKLFTVSPSNRVESYVCGASVSDLVVTGPSSGDSVTVTITPSATACTGSSGGVSGGGSSGGGGGGGGASTTVTPAATPAKTVVATVATAVSSELRQIVELFIALGIIPADKAEKARSVLAQQAPAVSTTVSGTFSRALGKGTTHADVKRLQQLLNSDADTRIATSGAGSPGSESQFYGALTEKAVQKFQVKYGIAKAGEPGYGSVGPKTRAKLKEVFGQ